MARPDLKIILWRQEREHFLLWLDVNIAHHHISEEGMAANKEYMKTLEKEILENQQQLEDQHA